MPSSLVSRMSGFATVPPSMMRHLTRSLPGQACISGADAALGARRKTSQTLASHKARLAWGDAPGARLAPHPELLRPTGRPRLPLYTGRGDDGRSHPGVPTFPGSEL